MSRKYQQDGRPVPMYLNTDGAMAYNVTDPKAPSDTPVTPPDTKPITIDPKKPTPTSKGMLWGVVLGVLVLAVLFSS